MKFALLLLVIGFSIAASAEVRGNEGLDAVVEGGRKLLLPLFYQPLVDDKNFRYIYENKKGKVFDLGGCDFVGKMPRKRCVVKIDGTRVSDSCPATCEAFPKKYRNGKMNMKMNMKMKMGMKPGKDKDGFKYYYKNKKGEEVVKEDGCGFVSKRKEKRCSKTVKGDKVSDMCPETCKGYDDDHVEFSLEGTRTYLGCGAEFFEMNIACGVPGDDDPGSCLLRIVAIGRVIDDEGENVIEAFDSYGKDIDDIDPEKTCISSGTFSLDQVVGDTIEPIPLIVSGGCDFEGVTEDYQYVVKGAIDRKENTIQLSYSNNYGDTYYTDDIETAEVYTAIIPDDNHEKVKMKMNKRRLSHTSGGNVPWPSWYIEWRLRRGLSIPGCAGSRPTALPTASPVTTAPVSTRAPLTFKQRDLGDASQKGKTKRIII